MVLRVGWLIAQPRSSLVIVLEDPYAVTDVVADRVKEVVGVIVGRGYECNLPPEVEPFLA